MVTYSLTGTHAQAGWAWCCWKDVDFGTCSHVSVKHVIDILGELISYRITVVAGFTSSVLSISHIV